LGGGGGGGGGQRLVGSSRAARYHSLSMLSGTVRRFVANLWLFSQEIDCSPITGDSDIIELGNVCRHNRPISARSYRLWSLHTSVTILVSRLESRFEATARSVVGQSTAEHLQHMLSSEQGIDHAVEAGS
jgi:hypothetical protein